MHFCIVLAMVLLLSEESRQWLGDPGVYGLASLTGIVGIDSITFSLLDMSDKNLADTVAFAFLKKFVHPVVCEQPGGIYLE